MNRKSMAAAAISIAAIAAGCGVPVAMANSAAHPIAAKPAGAFMKVGGPGGHAAPQMTAVGAFMKITGPGIAT